MLNIEFIFATPLTWVIGMWRSWLAHLVWDQGVLRSSRSIPTKKTSRLQNFEVFFLQINSKALPNLAKCYFQRFGKNP
mgnify:CR=1 FL=1